MSHRFVPIIPAELAWKQDLPYSSQFDDIYYSEGNAMEHSRRVFIEGNNLINRWAQLTDDSQSQFTIAETGFGTGLNFLLTWYLWEQYAPESAQLRYLSCELHPIQVTDLIKIFSEWKLLARFTEEFIRQYPILTPGMHNLSFNNGRVHLTLMLGDATTCYEQLLITGEPQLESNLRTAYVDAWYLDGFAPEKNPEMWSDSLFRIIALLSRNDCTLSTFTADGKVKNSLQQNGFQLNKTKSYGEKKYMVTAFKAEPTVQGLNKIHTPWQATKPTAATEKKAIIVGAGLAGCFTARSLTKRGWQITLIDELAQIGSSASANQQAILFPKLSAYRSPLSQFMLSAFLYSNNLYSQLITESHLGELNGSLLLAHNQKEQQTQDSLSKWLAQYPQLGMLLDSEQASSLAGIPVKQKALYIPGSGWINSLKLCQLLIEHQAISLLNNTHIDNINYHKGNWQVGNIEAPVLILTAGHKLSLFPQTRHLPIKAIRGQMTFINASQESAGLKIPISGDGQVVPAMNGMHTVGATYGLNSTDSQLNSKDDSLNIDKLKQLLPDISWSNEVIDSWSGIRAATPDYLPIVGPVAQAEQFKELFGSLASDANRFLASPGSYYPGLYACAGFGSRGLTTIPLCSEYLAAVINQEFDYLPRNLIQALSPARFLRRAIVRNEGH